MDDSQHLQTAVEALLHSQRFAVLATQGDEHPHLSLMAFAATSDLRQLVLATERDTRKYANLVSNPRLALLIDNRTNEGTDIYSTIAVTVVGQAAEVEEPDRQRLQGLFLAKHPHLESFVRSPSCALLGVKVERYDVVSRFQDVKGSAL